MLRKLKALWRLIVINYVLARHGLGRWLLDSHFFSAFSPWRLLIYFNLGYWLSPKQFSCAQALRQSLEALGPFFVKFGQALSTRPDLLPDDVIAELSLLQDRVAPFSGTKAIKLVEACYGVSIHDVFQDFEVVPLASASIAQVHAATLLDGKKVIVKILRPNIRGVIERDIALLYTLADFLERHWKDAQRLRIREVVNEFERTILDELDLMREAANASQLKRNFSQSDELYIPEVYWQHTREKVLVQERIFGIPISDFKLLKQHHVNFKKLAERGVEIFFTQVFRDCFFHADMHPGNIFVSFEHPNSPKYIAVDFGIMGSLSDHDQHYLAQNFLAFFRRDYRRVAELHIESGWVPYETRVDEFEAAIRTVCEPIFERPLSEISYGQVLLKLFQTGRRFNMEVQPQLILLQKTLLAIEGLGRQLYPELDLWKTAKPFLEDWIKRRTSIRALLKKVHANFPYWIDQSMEVPVMLFEMLEFKRQQQLRLHSQQRHHLSQNTEKNFCRRKYPVFFTVGILFIGVMIGWFAALHNF